MSATNWLTLKTPDQKTLRLWCIGGVISGFGVLLLALRDSVPALLSYPLANFLILQGTLLRVKSLRLESNLKLSAATTVVITVLAIAVFEIIRHTENHVLRVQYNATVHGIAFIWLGLEAWRISRRINSPNAIWLSITHNVLGAALLLRALELFIIPGEALGSTPGNFGIAMTAILATTFAHLAYTGMRLDQQSTKLEFAENQFREILLTARDGFFIIDDKGRFLDANDSLCKILGYSKPEILRMSVNDVDIMMTPDSVKATIQEIVDTGFARFETRDRRGDGTVIDVEVSVAILSGKDKLQLGFLRDITKEKQFQSELERLVKTRTSEAQAARDAAEAANAVKTSFIQNFSHEMRTPLTSIMGFAELGLLSAKSDDQSKFTQLFQSILDAALQQSRLVDRLLRILNQSWRNKDKKEILDSRINIESLVTDCIDSLLSSAQSRHQSIQLKMETLVGSITGNRLHIDTALEHLLSNALRYSPEYSAVTLHVTDKKLPMDARQLVAFRVLDNGCGIPEKELFAIFEPFHESSRTRDGAGSQGLGLPLCKLIAERHGGTLSAANNPSGGGRF